MTKEQKLKRDEKALKLYEKQLRNRRKEYAQIADAYSRTGQRMRAEALGECALKLIENLRKLKGEKNLLDGTLFWTIGEERVKDMDGVKGFHYTVTFHVKSDEDAFTEEEIRKEIEETRAKMVAETEEMYAEEPPFDEDEK